MPNPLIAYLFIDPADADDFTGPGVSRDQTSAAVASLLQVQDRIDRARAILADPTIDAVVVGLALDAVRLAADDLAPLAFDMHGMGG
jgi:hypothetical protein